MTHAAAINILESIPEKYMDKVIELLESFKKEITKTTAKKKKRDWREEPANPIIEAMARQDGKTLPTDFDYKKMLDEIRTERYGA